MDGWMDGWKDGWVGGWMDGGMEGWMDGWRDRGVDGWMEGWMDGYAHTYINYTSTYVCVGEFYGSITRDNRFCTISTGPIGSSKYQTNIGFLFNLLGGCQEFITLTNMKHAYA